ncbi:putative ABC transporter ATP-binding protein YheS [Variibacter gotjawalensis]|uniref:Putative ABC transporter ATP-binding protein YheS n=1 Tax=Variibacter gotjawalensis TaxID=1333996 RepID=A0A0S3PYC3_9BRAD|nr:ABC-F family ATP-binding cassette domain-containing protein [Variibacter gotjawalensis]NIK46791.1 ATP-binding cassette subfamily F protein 3 [Variibacter gotjawalensis]RZS48695.1 ATP-binding cassette subfamily F protein 3 [Variibacter gotjawalensis]BAT60954.1 putative ABC transporter ATP-binding protein YheS [Variibacter gotjawalensis]
MLILDDLTYRLGDRALLDGASAQIPAQARIGLIGRNGVGKTTLFKILMGELPTESGTITIPKRARIGRLAQEAPGGDDKLVDVVLAAASERNELLAAAERATDPGEIADIQSRLADIGAHAAPARAAAILAGLGFSESDQQRACREFSGGWRMRVALAAALFSEPDYLLLDEPTNYLDLEGTLWLQQHLARYPRTVIIISHDRDLLDNAVDWTLHMANGKLTLYRGGYTSFERARREKQLLDAKLAKQQENQRKHLQSFIDRFKAQATKAKQAQSRVKMLARLEPVSALISDEVKPIVLPAAERKLSPPIIALDNVAVGYSPDNPILKRLSLRIDDDDRIALLGANGNGKSTLAKLLARRLAPLSGNITWADKLAVGYFAQHQLDELRPNENAYEHLRRLMPDSTEAQVRTRAGSFGFSGDKADTVTAQLSGGEKARLLLGLATFGGSHLIVLDEPTNHLDIDSRAALIEAINDFPGALILVSHDRFMLEACVDRLWLVGNGGVAPFEGDLDDYRKIILGGGERESSRSDAPKQNRADERRQAAEKRANLAPLRREIKALEDKMEKLGAEIAKLDAALAASDLFVKGAGKAAELGKARSVATETLAKVENEWLEKSAAYESETA